MAQYRELAAFAQFGTAELDKATRAQIDRGQRITEVLKQLQYVPMKMEKQVTILYAAINGFLDDIPVARVQDFESRLHQYIETHHPGINKTIAETKTMSDETEAELKTAVSDFKRTFKA